MSSKNTRTKASKYSARTSCIKFNNLAGKMSPRHFEGPKNSTFSDFVQVPIPRLVHLVHVPIPHLVHLVHVPIPRLVHLVHVPIPRLVHLVQVGGVHTIWLILCTSTR